MSLDLNLTLSCENYSTGVISNVAYAEEREVDIVEQHAPEASGCQRIYYCNWTERALFVHNLLGFANVQQWVGGNLEGGWNGKYIHRVLPHGYDMGVDDGLGTPVNWVYATRATVQPYGGKLKNHATYKTPIAEYARVTVQYAGLDYLVISDTTTRYPGTSGGAVAHMAEWERFSRIVQKPAAQYFQYPQAGLKLVDWPKPGGGTKGINFQPAVIDNVADFLIYVKDLPYDPITNVMECFGKLNLLSVFSTPDNLSGQPAETLHFIAADITRLPMRMGVKYWDLMLGFKKVYNKNQLGVTVGHNHVRDLVDEKVGANTVKRLRFFRVSNDGTANLSTGNPMIDLVDFRKIFWIP